MMAHSDDGSILVAEACSTGGLPYRIGSWSFVRSNTESSLVLSKIISSRARPGQVVKAGQLDGLDRAGLLTHPTVNAPQLVDDEVLGIFLAVWPGRRGGRPDDIDAMGRAGGRAEHAGHALDPTLLHLC